MLRLIITKQVDLIQVSILGRQIIIKIKILSGLQLETAAQPTPWNPNKFLHIAIVFTFDMFFMNIWDEKK